MFSHIHPCKQNENSEAATKDPYKMKGPRICYIKKLIYKIMKQHFHFHIYLWLLQYIHDVSIVPDGNTLTKLRYWEISGEDVQVMNMKCRATFVTLEINKYNFFKSELKYIKHKTLKEKSNLLLSLILTSVYDWKSSHIVRITAWNMCNQLLA